MSAGRVLGAVIAGGASTRFGSPKALAQVGGVRVVDRVVHALRSALDNADIVAIANDPALAAAIGLPHRSDAISGVGAIAGVHAALLEARDRGLDGCLAAGCDMPFLDAALLRAIVDAAGEGIDIVLPESDGPRGVEPLCAWYGVSCIAAIEEAAARGDARLIGFHDSVSVCRIPLAVVRSYGEPSTLFMNLNTPADHERAQHRLGPL